MARMARGTRGTPNKKKVTRLTFLYLFFFEINGDLCIFVARYNFQNIINIINIQLMTTKKMYEKPSMRVFPLRQKPQLLVGSYTTTATMDDEWTEENI